MSPFDDLNRLRREYADREKRLAGCSRYSPVSPDYLFTIQQRQRAVLKCLRQKGIRQFTDMRILEVGCGSGGVLLEFLVFGADQHHIFGIDLLPKRLADAQDKLPSAYFTCADGQALPYPPQSFDLVLQFTSFSSILDDHIKMNMAREMLRTLKPSGIIIWYDFWLNPFNRQTRGIRPKEIKTLFSGCKIKFSKITLAPPIARKVVPISWGFGTVLEAMKLLNSHYLAVIQKNSQEYGN